MAIKRTKKFVQDVFVDDVKKGYVFKKYGQFFWRRSGGVVERFNRDISLIGIGDFIGKFCNGTRVKFKIRNKGD